MKPLLIIGLGNPGDKYAKTRHNVGFMILDALADKLDVKWSDNSKGNALVAELNYEGRKIILAKPQTFMNNSGNAAASLADQFGVDTCSIWAVYDEASLPFGVLRIRLEGSAGGHNGVKSLIASLGAEDFVRFRIGVSEPPENIALDDWVLSRFSKDELGTLEELIPTIVERMMNSLDGNLDAITENLSE